MLKILFDTLVEYMYLLRCIAKVVHSAIYNPCTVVFYSAAAVWIDFVNINYVFNATMFPFCCRSL